MGSPINIWCVLYGGAGSGSKLQFKRKCRNSEIIFGMAQEGKEKRQGTEQVTGYCDPGFIIRQGWLDKRALLPPSCLQRVAFNIILKLGFNHETR